MTRRAGSFGTGCSGTTTAVRIRRWGIGARPNTEWLAGSGPELATVDPSTGKQTWTSNASSAEDVAQAKAIAAGVLSSTHAPGWLLWPAEVGLIEPDTLVQLAKAVQQYPMVFPEYRQQRGQPIGLSSEFYSELIRLNTEWDLNRLMNRYPALGIEVNDPGVLIPQDMPFDLPPLATLLPSAEPRYLAALPY